MKNIEFYGITKDKAIENAQKTLGIDKEALRIKYVENTEKKKIISSILDEKRNKILVDIIQDKVRKNTYNYKELEEVYIKVSKFLNELKVNLKEIGFEYSIKSSGRKIYVEIQINKDLEDNEYSKELLFTLEKLLNSIITKNNYLNIKVYIDVQKYNVNRKKELVEIAKSSIIDVLEKGKIVELEPMNSYERRIVHAVLKREKVKTKSKGKEPNRYIVIYPR